jgi:hypothetical protein
MRAVLVQTAKAWGYRPSELGLCAPDEDLAYMVAWENAERTMVAWEYQVAEKEQRRGRAKNRS